MCTRQTTGFTLAELLISLAILGVIATFTIPKVLNSIQSGEKKAIFRETIAATSNIFYNGIRDGEFETAPFFGAVYDEHLNYIERCGSGPPNDCWATSEVDAGVQYRLASGTGIRATNSGRIEIDWNGLDDPNTVGDDRISLQTCPAQGCGDNSYLGTPPPYGRILPRDAASNTLQNEIFSN